MEIQLGFLAVTRIVFYVLLLWRLSRSLLESLVAVLPRPTKHGLDFLQSKNVVDYECRGR